MNLISLFGAIGLTAVCGLNPVTQNITFEGAYYNVNAHYPANSQVPDYIQGNLNLEYEKYNFNNPQYSTNTGLKGAIYNSFTLFYEDNVVVDSGDFAYYTITPNVSLRPFIDDVVSTLNTDYSHDYYCGYYDIMFFAISYRGANHVIQYNFQWWYRFAFIGTKSVNSDFSFTLKNCMPNYDVTGTVYSCYSYNTSFDYSFFTMEGFSFDEMCLKTVEFNNLSYDFNTTPHDLPIFTEIYVDQNYPVKTIGTTGVGLRFYPLSAFCYAGYADEYVTGTFLTYTLALGDNVVNSISNALYFDSNNRSLCTFECDFQRTSYGESVAYNNGYNTGYSQGANVGENQGYERGLDEGFENGYNTGYATGKTDGISSANDYSFLGLFGAVADTPVIMIRSLFNFDFFGVNLLTVVLSLFTGIILFYLLRKLL